MASQIFVPIAATFLFYLLLWASRILYHNLTSPLRHVDGPKNPSLLYGNFKDMGVRSLVRYLQFDLTCMVGFVGGPKPDYKVAQ
jgi:hypothetical protein